MKNLESNLSRTYVSKNHSWSDAGRDLSLSYDFILTPGSYFRSVKGNFGRSEKPNSLGKYPMYAIAGALEGVRASTYIALGLVSPIAPLFFVAVGLISRIFNKNKKYLI